MAFPGSFRDVLFHSEVIAFQRLETLLSYQMNEANKQSLLTELAKATE